MKKLFITLFLVLFAFPSIGECIDSLREKNAASGAVIVFPLKNAAGTFITGVSVDTCRLCEWTDDGTGPTTSAACTNTVTEIDSTNMPGIYKLVLTQGEVDSNYTGVYLADGSTTDQFLLLKHTVGNPLNFATTDDGGAINVTTGAVDTVTTTTTATNLTTNNDKTGYALSSTQTFNVTGNVTGNLSGSVGSVTGAVGSVTGNVGGNVAGSTASVTAGVDLADDAITSAKYDESTAYPFLSGDGLTTNILGTLSGRDMLALVSSVLTGKIVNDKTDPDNWDIKYYDPTNDATLRVTKNNAQDDGTRDGPTLVAPF